MAEKVQSTEETPKPEGPPPPKRGLGHRGADPRDTAAELAARAHAISLEAGSKMAGAMRDVIHAAAGISGFVVESARDLLQFMVRRGQISAEEADKLIHEAEDAHARRTADGWVPSGLPETPEPSSAVAAPVEPAPVEVEAPSVPSSVIEEPEPEVPELQPEPDTEIEPSSLPVAKSAPKVAKTAAPAKVAAKSPAKTAAKSPAKVAVPAKGATKTVAKAPAKAATAAKTPTKTASKSSAKTPAKVAAKKAPAKKR